MTALGGSVALGLALFTGGLNSSRVAQARAERQKTLFAGPEALPLPERCLIGFSGSANVTLPIRL